MLRASRELGAREDRFDRASSPIAELRRRSMAAVLANRVRRRSRDEFGLRRCTARVKQCALSAGDWRDPLAREVYGVLADAIYKRHLANGCYRRLLMLDVAARLLVASTAVGAPLSGCSALGWIAGVVAVLQTVIPFSSPIKTLQDAAVRLADARSAGDRLLLELTLGPSMDEPTARRQLAEIKGALDVVEMSSENLVRFVATERLEARAESDAIAELGSRGYVKS